MRLRLASSARTPQGYRQTYAFEGPPGATLIQRVETEVRFELGGHALVSYRGRYAEFFRLDHEGRALEDLHEFDVRRDGWTLARMRDLLQRVGARGPDGGRLQLDLAPRLTMRKAFWLALGEVSQPRSALARASGAAFGFLAEGPGGAPWAELRCAPPVGAHWREAARAVAHGYEPGGRGAFVGGQGWALQERYRYDFASREYVFEDGGGYRPGPIPPGLGRGRR